MVVLSLEHAEPRISGYLCRHMYKIRPGVFVGNMTASRRNAIWKHMLEEQPDVDAVMCWDDANGQTAFLSTGVPTRKVITVDDVQMLSYRYEPAPDWKTKYAAKSETEFYPSKPLWEHMLESGIFARTLLSESAYQNLLPFLAGMAGLTQDQMLDDCTFIVSTHDLGKMHPLFQQRLLQTEIFFDEMADNEQPFRHEIYSTVLLKEWMKSHEPCMHTRNQVLTVIRDHHQCKDNNISKDFSRRRRNEGGYQDNYENREKVHSDADALIKWFAERYPYTPFQIEKDRDLVFFTLLSGALRLSDWSVSSFGQELSAQNYENDDTYIRGIRQRCLQYLADGGIMPHVFRNSYSYEDLFPAFAVPGTSLRPLQKTMIQVVSEHRKPDLIIIEGEMGSGKTETALYAAMNIMNTCGKQGIYYALPTGATAEAMLPRLQQMQDTAGLFQDVSLRLLTGMSWMLGDSDQDVRAAWSEKGPRKLFSTFACGTVDQLMAAGEALKAGDMRLLSLSNKVLVVDEFHAYDAYMLSILEVVLKWMKAMHVPVIIMSATLQKRTIQKLCSIYSGIVPSVQSYPQITICDDSQVREYRSEASDHKVYPVQMIEEEQAVEKCLESVRTGGDTLYIANTVGRALQIYQRIAENKPTDVTVRLYTACTTPENREKVGAELVYLFGHDGKKDGKRPKKTIVVATQIMEMSVDVDFDTEFLELAPIDSVLQRIGRMRRHEDAGTIRELGWQSVCYIIRPDKTRKNWALPYLESVLTETEKVLEGRSTISVAQDARELTDMVYESAEKAVDKQREELQKLVLAASKKIGVPGDSLYEKENDLKSLPMTRYVSYPSESVLCLTEEQIAEMPNANRNWCAEIIRKRSVASVAEYKLQGIPFQSVQNVPLYLTKYQVILDKPEYWGPEQTFIGNQEADRI